MSALLGRIPSAVGYQPTLATDMGGMQERITTTKKGSITSVQAIYVPADDLTDPAPATTFAHLDATTVLSRAIAELGIYPAVDPLDSTSRKSIFNFHFFSKSFFRKKTSAISIDAHSKLALHSWSSAPSAALLTESFILRSSKSHARGVKGP